MKQATISVTVFEYENIKGEKDWYIKYETNGKKVVHKTSVLKVNELKEMFGDENQEELPFNEAVVGDKPKENGEKSVARLGGKR